MSQSGDLDEDVRDARDYHAEIFELMDDAGEAGGERTLLRNLLVEANLPLVEHCARRFAGRGESLEDLVQVGTIGLIKAVDRFDMGRGVEFSTYATPTIVGEIKRHFRDRGWAIRVPRRLQELRMRINAATPELAQKLGRSPTPQEISDFLEVPVEDILEGMESANAYATVSIDGSGDDDDTAALLDVLGGLDSNIEAVELRESLKPLLAALSSREKEILRLRFFRGLTQTQIAMEVGISQMHVSRLLDKTLKALRSGLEEP